jgi:hypothetical protein
VHQELSDFKKAYDSFRREVLYNILIDFGIPMKSVWLTEMSVNGKQNEIRIFKHLSDAFPITMVGKKGDALSPLLFNFASEYTIRNVHEYRESFKLNGAPQLLVYADDINLFGENMKTVRRNKKALLAASTEAGLAISVENTKYIL